jgi:hypothetical protein
MGKNRIIWGWFPRVPLWIICYPRVKCPSWSVPIVWGVQKGLFIFFHGPQVRDRFGVPFVWGATRWCRCPSSGPWWLSAPWRWRVENCNMGGSINGGTLHEWMVYFMEKRRITLMKPGATMTYRAFHVMTWKTNRKVMYHCSCWILSIFSGVNIILAAYDEMLPVWEPQ